jgi:hypothetical protein
MSPATIALIAASLMEAAKLVAQLTNLISRANAGEIDDAVALEEWRKATASYESARDAWDNAGNPVT